MQEAIVILGGGVREGGVLPPWVEARLDVALGLRTGKQPLLCLSAGSPHAHAHVGYESKAMANALLRRGIPRESVFYETCSYDTIGNAYFARRIHTDPAGWSTLHIVTNDFHMARTKVVFDWVFALDNGGYQLHYHPAPDRGLEGGVLDARRAKEKQSLDAMPGCIARIRNLKELHAFLFTEHRAYSAGLEAGSDLPAILRDTY